MITDIVGNILDPAHDNVDFGVTIAAVVSITVQAYSDNLTVVRVTYSKAVKQVDPGNADDALNPANYSITGGVTVSAGATISSTVVELTVSGQVLGHTYTLTVANVEDLSNNVVAASANYTISPLYVPTGTGLLISSVSPARVANDGGYRMDLQGVFPMGIPLTVHIGETGTSGDTACVSGKAGQGREVYAVNPGHLYCFTPRLPVGGPYAVTVRRVVDDDATVLWDALSTIRPDYRTSVFDLRGMFPVNFLVGTRKIEDVPPIDF
jgi:hypothetical protein